MAENLNNFDRMAFKLSADQDQPEAPKRRRIKRKEAERRGLLATQIQGGAFKSNFGAELRNEKELDEVASRLFDDGGGLGLRELRELMAKQEKADVPAAASTKGWQGDRKSAGSDPRAKANEYKAKKMKMDGDKSDADVMVMEDHDSMPGLAGSLAASRKAKERREAKKMQHAKAAEAEVRAMPELLSMTEVQRADLIDELTRKAFVLMEAGEVSQATEFLNRASAVSTVFAKLEEELAEQDEYITVEEPVERGQSEPELLQKMRRDLHKDDLAAIFGGRLAQFIGNF